MTVGMFSGLRFAADAEKALADPETIWDHGKIKWLEVENAESYLISFYGCTSAGLVVNAEGEITYRSIDTSLGIDAFNSMTCTYDPVYHYYTLYSDGFLRRLPAVGLFGYTIQARQDSTGKTGATETTFAPDKTCTRGQVVSFLFRAFGPKG